MRSRSSAELQASDNMVARARIRIRKPPADVYKAFVDAKGMSAFWFTRRDSGLKQGENSTWYIGSGKDAVSFEVRVKELRPSEKIVIEWENGPKYTQVVWTMKRTPEGFTLLTIEESGFGGTQEQIVERVVDSTGGFNQVVVAAKAWIEHGIRLNVVDDHG